MRFNHHFWKTLNDRGITSMSKVYCPEILDDLPSSPRNEYLNEMLQANFISPDKSQENEKNENSRNENSRNSLLEDDEMKDEFTENKQSNEQTQL